MPVAADTGEVKNTDSENEGEDRVAWLSKMEGMMDPALKDCQVEKDSRVAEIAEKTVVDALKCVQSRNKMDLSDLSRHWQKDRSLIASLTNL